MDANESGALLRRLLEAPAAEWAAVGAPALWATPGGLEHLAAAPALLGATGVGSYHALLTLERSGCSGVCGRIHRRGGNDGTPVRAGQQQPYQAGLGLNWWRSSYGSTKGDGAREAPTAAA